jgi:hypothetical protein
MTEELESVSAEEITPIEAAINRVVHKLILPALQRVADQATEILASQNKSATDIKELFGRMNTLEARFERLYQEHVRCSNFSDSK